MSETPDPPARAVGARLRILATSDVHMHMTGWDARQEHMARGVGLDQLALTIHKARDTAPGPTLLLDNGDMLQGTPEGDNCAQPDSTAAHPWPPIAAALGYDAMGLGNHDFDFGLPFLERIVDDMQAPVLCASLSEGQIRGVAPSALLTRTLPCPDGTEQTARIGITSVLPPQTMIWNVHSLAGRVSFDGGVAATRRAVAGLRADGADIVIVLCHSGLSRDTDPGTENFAVQIAAQVPGIDAMILGHTHRRFPGEDHGVGALVEADTGTVMGVPAVMPEYSAQSLGMIDLDLVRGAEGWQVTGHAVSLLCAAQGDTDPAITALAAPSIAATRALMAVPLSTTAHHIHSYFNALQTGTEVALAAQAMTRVIADEVAGTPLAALPLIASVCSAAAGGHGGVTNYVNIPRGTVLARHTAMLCPYRNEVWAAVLTGAALRDWAERSAAYFAPDRGTLSLLANPDAPFFNFDTLIGLETTIDPFAPPRFDVSGALLDPAATRIHALRHNGTEVADDARFLVAMSSYRGAGGGTFPGLDTAEAVLQTEADLSRALTTVLQEAPLGDAPAPTAWHFAPDLNAPVIIETAPQAAQHLTEIARFDPHPMGLSDAGFLRLRVTI